VRADLRKKPLHPNLNHSIPKVGTKKFDRGTYNGSKTSHELVDLGNMMLLPKLAKQREFDPCKHWVVPVPDSHKEKIRRVGKAQEIFFSNNGCMGFFSSYFFPP
jgi:hypothetical protein